MSVEIFQSPKEAELSFACSSWKDEPVNKTQSAEQN